MEYPSAKHPSISSSLVTCFNYYSKEDRVKCEKKRHLCFSYIEGNPVIFTPLYDLCLEMKEMFLKVFNLDNLF